MTWIESPQWPLEDKLFQGQSNHDIPSRFREVNNTFQCKTVLDLHVCVFVRVCLYQKRFVLFWFFLHFCLLMHVETSTIPAPSASIFKMALGGLQSSVLSCLSCLFICVESNCDMTMCALDTRNNNYRTTFAIHFLPFHHAFTFCTHKYVLGFVL